MRMAPFYSSAVDAYRKLQAWLGNLDGPEACNWAASFTRDGAGGALQVVRAKAEKRFVAQCERARAQGTLRSQ